MPGLPICNQNKKTSNIGFHRKGVYDRSHRVLSIHNLVTANLAEFAKHVHGFIIPSVETASIVNIPQQREMRRVGIIPQPTRLAEHVPDTYTCKSTDSSHFLFNTRSTVNSNSFCFFIAASFALRSPKESVCESVAA